MNKASFTKKHISIIGAGRVGTTISAVITGLEIPRIKIVSIISRSENSLERAAGIIGEPAKKIIFSRDFRDIPGESNCFMICTPDDIIKESCTRVIDSIKSDLNKRLFIHFSGAKSLNVLQAAISMGASAISIHPIKSFASIKDSINTIKDTVFGVTHSNNCSDDSKVFVQYLLGRIDGKIIMVDDNKKSIYHASACVASNYLVSLINYAIKINEAIGISPQDSLIGLMGLIKGTVANIEKMGSKKSLTGPIARGDVGTIKGHIDSFKRFLGSEDVAVYKIMGRQASRIAYENKWIDRKTFSEFLNIFSMD